MASKVSICNNALISIGAKTIISLEDGTDEAIKCSVLYQVIADEVMMRGPWTRACSRASLAQLADAPAFGYLYQYQLPTVPVCLRILGIDESLRGEIDYRIEGNALLTDEETVKVRYIGRIENTEDYGPHLTSALIIRLAAALAYDLTGQRSIAEAKLQEYEAKVEYFLSMDNIQGSNERIQSNDFLDVR
jgi:hypothetical protein